MKITFRLTLADQECLQESFLKKKIILTNVGDLFFWGSCQRWFGFNRLKEGLKAVKKIFLSLLYLGCKYHFGVYIESTENSKHYCRQHD